LSFLIVELPPWYQSFSRFQAEAGGETQPLDRFVGSTRKEATQTPQTSIRRTGPRPQETEEKEEYRRRSPIRNAPPIHTASVSLEAVKANTTPALCSMFIGNPDTEPENREKRSEPCRRSPKKKETADKYKKYLTISIPTNKFVQL